MESRPGDANSREAVTDANPAQNCYSASHRSKRNKQLQERNKKIAKIVAKRSLDRRTFWAVFRAILFGLVLMVLGIAMAVLGYYRDQTSSTQSGDDAKDDVDHPSNRTTSRRLLLVAGGVGGAGTSTAPGDESSRLQFAALSYVGPCVMGCGMFALMMACVMTLEGRDRNTRIYAQRLMMRKRISAQRKSVEAGLVDRVGEADERRPIGDDERPIGSQPAAISETSKEALTATAGAAKQDACVAWSKERPASINSVYNGDQTCPVIFRTQMTNRTDLFAHDFMAGPTDLVKAVETSEKAKDKAAHSSAPMRTMSEDYGKLNRAFKREEMGPKVVAKIREQPRPTAAAAAATKSRQISMDQPIDTRVIWSADNSDVSCRKTSSIAAAENGSQDGSTPWTSADRLLLQRFLDEQSRLVDQRFGVPTAPARSLLATRRRSSSIVVAQVHRVDDEALSPPPQRRRLKPNAGVASTDRKSPAYYGPKTGPDSKAYTAKTNSTIPLSVVAPLACSETLSTTESDPSPPMIGTRSVQRPDPPESVQSSYATVQSHLTSPCSSGCPSPASGRRSVPIRRSISKLYDEKPSNVNLLVFDPKTSNVRRTVDGKISTGSVQLAPSSAGPFYCDKSPNSALIDLRALNTQSVYRSASGLGPDSSLDLSNCQSSDGGRYYDFKFKTSRQTKDVGSMVRL